MVQHFILKCDRRGVRRSDRDLLSTSSGQSPTTEEEIPVLEGSLWVLESDSCHGVQPPWHVSGAGDLTLRWKEDGNVAIQCFEQEVDRLSTDEYDLLAAITSCGDRMKVYQDRHWLEEGINFRMNDLVYVLDILGIPEQKVPGKIRYKGGVPQAAGTWFGVELSCEYSGKGTSDGLFRRKRFFHCAMDSALFLPLSKLRRCPIPTLFTEAAPQCLEAGWTDPHLPNPDLQIGERVVWISDIGPEHGTVKWIGILPDASQEWTVGVEFDQRIGTGTGKYRDKQLFRARQNHASLVPISGLLKETDFLPPPDPSLLRNNDQNGSTSTLSTRPPSPPECYSPNSQRAYSPVSESGLLPPPPPSCCTENGHDSNPASHNSILSDGVHIGLSSTTGRIGLGSTNVPHKFSSNRYANTWSHKQNIIYDDDEEDFLDGELPPDRPQKNVLEKERSIYDKHVYENISNEGSRTGSPDENLYDNCDFRNVGDGYQTGSLYDNGSSHSSQRIMTAVSTSSKANARNGRLDLTQENVRRMEELEMKDQHGYYDTPISNHARSSMSTHADVPYGVQATCDTIKSPDTAPSLKHNPTDSDVDSFSYQRRHHKSEDNLWCKSSSKGPASLQLPYHTGKSTFYEHHGCDTGEGSTVLDKQLEEDYKKLFSQTCPPGVTTAGGNVQPRGIPNSNVTDSPKSHRSGIHNSAGSTPSSDTACDSLGKSKGLTDFFHKANSKTHHGSVDSMLSHDTSASIGNHSKASSQSKSPSLLKKLGAHISAASSKSDLDSKKQNSVESTGSNRSDEKWTSTVKRAPSTAEMKEEYVPISMTSVEAKTDLEKGDVVEVVGNPENCRYGVIKWIGYMKDPGKAVVGLELEEESAACTDGVFGGHRVFTCQPRRAFFVHLHKVKRDSRFQESNRYLERSDSTAFGSLECPDIPGAASPPPAFLDVNLYVGRNRGIQGHHNSCYLDAMLFGMFAFSLSFDRLLHRPRNNGDIKEYDEVQKVLRECIINPLRSKFYVRADKIMKLRKLLDKLSTVEGLMGEEKDPEEFLNSLLSQILKADPFLVLSTPQGRQEAHYYQLFIEKEEWIPQPTTQQLLGLSFLQADTKLSQRPSCLILQMPRCGKDFRMYKRIVPSLYIDISDILEYGPRQCHICCMLATYECKDCYKQFGDGTSLERIAFCEQCLRKVHNHTKRKDHKPKALKVDRHYQRFLREQESRSNVEFTIPRTQMELFAVVCIATSHYVAFTKCGSGPQAPWVFFDSMADRMGEAHGYNIPEVQQCDALPEWLLEESYSRTLTRVEDRDMPEHMRRLLCDGYICMYQSTDTLMYK